MSIRSRPWGMLMIAVVSAAACGGAPGAGRDAGGPGPLVDFGGGVSVAYQIDIAHTGNQPASTLRPPLTKRWSVDLKGPVSYPLIVGGRAFVTVASTTTTDQFLYALDVATGATSWGPVNVGVNWANAAYDDGKIYVVNDDGDVAAYDAASGTRVWFQTSPTSQSSASSPPIAKDGMVFGAASGIGGTVFALDGKTGALQWRAQVANGDQSSPSLGPEGLFVSYACLQTYGFNPIEGSLLWHADGPCQGGGGMTTALYQGQLWTRDWSTGNQVVDARSGAMLHGFEGDRIPAFLGSRAFILLDSTLRAIDLATFATLWSFTGDGALTSAPLVAGGFVYITSRAGLVFAVDPATGDSPWSAELGAFVNEVGNTHDFVFTPMPGLAAGQGVLLVPQGPLLVAFQ